MNKRDLKADLDWMMKSPSDHAKELEIAVHALERAITAEADLKRQEEYSDMVEDERNKLYRLAEELAEALKEHERWEVALVLDDKSWATADGLPHFSQEIYDSWMEIQAARNKALEKAKEVLEDD